MNGSANTKTVSGDIGIASVTAGDVHFTSVSGDVEIGIAQRKRERRADGSGADDNQIA